MKTSNGLLVTVVFIILYAVLIYATRGIWQNFTLSALTTLTAPDMLIIASAGILEYLIISGIAVSIVAHKKKGFRNLKNSSEGGLVYELTNGLILGLLCGFIGCLIGGILVGFGDGLVMGLVFGFVILLTIGLTIGLVLGLILGLVAEFD